MKLRRIFFLVATAFSSLIASCTLALNQGTGSVALSVAMKQPAGAVTSIALVITGPAMDTIAPNLSPTETQVTLEVPPGEDRRFVVLVNTRYLTFKGESTVDLRPGQIVAVPVQVVLASTPIVAPDPLDNQRLVQIEDMTGRGWVSVDYQDLGVGMTSAFEFKPYDVDFDAQGRIYVANFYDGIVRLDSIDDDAAEWFARPGAGAFYTLALATDRTNGWVYYCDYCYPTNLNRLPVADVTTAAQPIALSTIPAFAGGLQVYGLDTDSDGYLYISGSRSGTNGIYKIDPQTPGSPTLVASHEDTRLIYPTDVAVEDSYVNVANQTGFDGNKIIQLTKALDFAQGYGNEAPPLPTAPQPGDFYGPSRFVATINRKVTLIDEYDSEYYDRLISFDEADGSNWETYGEYGSGVGQFIFYNSY